MANQTDQLIEGERGKSYWQEGVLEAVEDQRKKIAGGRRRSDIHKRRKETTAKREKHNREIRIIDQRNQFVSTKEGDVI